MLENLISDTLVWLFIGIVFVILELVSATFVFLFFGLAAFLIAFSTMFGFHNVTWQIVVFTALSVVSLFFFRKKLMASTMSDKDQITNNDLQNEVFVVDQNIEPHEEKTVTFRGTVWKARNNSETTLQKGERVVIQKTEGIKLIIAKKE